MRFPPADPWPRWELWVRPEATGGKWIPSIIGTYAELLDEQDRLSGRGYEYSIRRAKCPASESTATKLSESQQSITKTPAGTAADR